MAVLFLLDTNVAIAGDPLSTDLEPGAPEVIELLRMLSAHRHDVRTHPASMTDFARDTNNRRREARLATFRKYEALAEPPVPTPRQRELLGEPRPGSNDAVDHELLAAVVGDAVSYLVTDDIGIHRLARRLAVAERVLSVPDALTMLATLHAAPPNPPPSVRRAKLHQLERTDQIFDGLRNDYPGFDEWYADKSREQREAFVVDAPDGSLAGVCIFKVEPGGEHGMPGPLLKLSTFKVSERHAGHKYGELLLKAAFEHAHVQALAGVFVTVFAKHESLVALLETFGFNAIDGATTALGELVVGKPLLDPDGVAARMQTADWPLRPGRAIDEQAASSPLESHVRFGPPHLRLSETTPHFVPVEPRWHRVLFPDAEPADEGALFSAVEVIHRPVGNALRKAYLCRAQTRQVRPGDPLLFYRSGDEQSVYVIGVCEAAHVSRDPGEIAALVGQRTVYSLDEIREQTRAGEVLVLLFRQDRVLRDRPITLPEAEAAGLVVSHPQSTQRARAEGIAWLTQRLDE